VGDYFEQDEEALGIEDWVKRLNRKGRHIVNDI
jgi:hypothetical protein